MKLRYLSLLIASIGCVSSNSGRAAILAHDNSANSTYEDGWQTGDGGGYGWGSAWNLNSNSSGSPFSLDANWGILAAPSSTTTASRSFGGSISVGQTFNIDYITPTLSSGASGGVRLFNSAGNLLWEFNYFGGFFSYTIHDAQGSRRKSADRNSQGIHIEFTLTSMTKYSVSVTSLGSSTTSLLTGNLIPQVGGAGISNFTLYLENTRPTGTFTQSFNNISVIPEPSMIGALGVFSAIVYRLSKRQAMRKC